MEPTTNVDKRGAEANQTASSNLRADAQHGEVLSDDFLTTSVYRHADAPEWESVKIKVPAFTGPEKQRSLLVDAVCLVGTLIFGTARLLTGGKKKIHEPKKILIIRRGGIGDVVLITPLVRALKENFPGVRIQLLTSRQAVAVFAGNPYIDEILQLPSGKKGWLEFVGRMRSEKIDTALILHRIYVVSLIATLLGIPQRLGYRWKRHGFALTGSIPFDASRAQVVQINELMKLFGKPVPPSATEIFFSDENRVEVAEALRTLQYDPKKRLVAIHPGTSEVMGIGQSAGEYAHQQEMLKGGNTCRTPRRWPTQHFSALADMFIERDGYQVLILQGPADEQAVSAMIEGMKQKPFGVSPKMGLKSFALLLGSCDLVIANDSGPMHLAKAAGAPVLAIFGASHAGYNGPLGARHRVAWNPVECSPCYHADEFATINSFTGAKVFECWRGDHRCMRELMPVQVYRLAQAQLDDLGVTPQI